MVSFVEKVQEEIDRVIGRSREPSIADKANMPFTEAVMHEIMRFGDVIPMNGLRVANKDTTLGECFIPKVSDILFSCNTKVMHLFLLKIVLYQNHTV